MSKICTAGCVLVLWTASVGRVSSFAPNAVHRSPAGYTSGAAQTPQKHEYEAPLSPRPDRCSPRNVNLHASSLGQQLETFDPAVIRCPFFRRRATDTLEALVVVGTWLRARHKRIDLTFGLLPLSTRANSEDAHAYAVAVARKTHNLPLASMAALLARDFADKQCQVTGHLSRQLFDEACIFDGPDPDLPVTGIGKYLAASAQLFAHAQSRCDLLAVATVDTVPAEIVEARKGVGAKAFEGGRSGVLVVWRIEGTVNLPWHPTIKPYYGATLYELQVRVPDGALGSEVASRAATGSSSAGSPPVSEVGGGGLVARATEWWSVQAADAFLAAVAPGAAAQVFGTEAAPTAADLRSQGLLTLLEQLHGFPPSLPAAATEMDDWREVLHKGPSH